MDKIKISLPVIVEGRYDKNKLSSVIDADIFTTDGFSVFNRRDKLDFFQKIAENGVILLCDSDGAGTLIRSYITRAIPKDKIYQLYTPQIKGKEKRKRQASAEGYLGVEGIEADVLREMFLPFSKGNIPIKAKITKLDLYETGLTGKEDSKDRRTALLRRLSLPLNLSANAMLSALNVTLKREEFFSVTTELFGERNE